MKLISLELKNQKNKSNLLKNLDFEKIKFIKYGDSHIVIVTMNNKVFVYGSNYKGQTGLDPNSTEEFLEINYVKFGIIKFLICRTIKLRGENKGNGIDPVWQSQVIDDYGVQKINVNEKNNVIYLVDTELDGYGGTATVMRFVSRKNGEVLPQMFYKQGLSGGNTNYVYDNQGNAFVLFGRGLNGEVALYNISSNLSNFKLVLNSLESDPLLRNNIAWKVVSGNFVKGIAVQENGVNIVYATSTDGIHKFNADNGKELTRYPTGKSDYVLLNDVIVVSSVSYFNMTLTVYDRKAGELVGKFNVSFKQNDNNDDSLNVLLIPLANNEFMLSVFEITYSGPKMSRTYSNQLFRKYQMVKSSGNAYSLVLKFAVGSNNHLYCDTLLSGSNALNNAKVVLSCIKGETDNLGAAIVTVDTIKGGLTNLVDSSNQCQEVVDSSNSNLYQCCYKYNGPYQQTTCSAFNIPK
ncbi:hypothetical protein ABK040_011132 [Willaertia magna]